MHHSHIDKFAYQDSLIHRLDSRVKLIVTIVFTAVVISLPQTSLSILFCYAVGPFVVLTLAGIPIKFVLKQILMVSPFILVLALSCLLYDSEPVNVALGPFMLHIRLGWIKCFAILGKFTVTMSALIALVSTTRFSDLLTGARRLGLPKLLAIQLGFLYRYIFILIDCIHRMLRARQVRKLRNLGFAKELKIGSAMVGSLFIRSLEKAERISTAMQARGFDGNWHSICQLRTGCSEWIFVLVTGLFILGLYLIAPFIG